MRRAGEQGRRVSVRRVIRLSLRDAPASTPGRLRPDGAAPRPRAIWLCARRLTLKSSSCTEGNVDGNGL